MILMVATHVACFEDNAIAKASGVWHLPARPSNEIFFGAPLLGPVCAEAQAPDSVKVSLEVPVD